MICSKSSPHLTQRGFSLIEMAIVLTIIALLVGSILTGKNMIRSSEVQATASQVQVYRGAVNKFTDRFIELPGDFTTASSNWAGTYDGNGDGHIGGDLDTSCAGDFEEQWAAFEHMGKAELIEGQYDTSGGSMPNPGVNTPATPIAGGGYTLRFCGDIGTSTSYFVGYYGHVIQIGRPAAGGTRGPLFTPEEAASIDKKLDDSYPATGKIKAPQKDDGDAPDCTTTNDASDADYNFDVDADYANGPRRCTLFFLMGF